MNQYEFAKSEIDIVVESFQMILNDIGEAFKKQLDESRESVTKYIYINSYASCSLL